MDADRRITACCLASAVCNNMESLSESIHSNVAWSAKYYDDTRMIGVMYAGVSLKQQGLDEFVYFGTPRNI